MPRFCLYLGLIYELSVCICSYAFSVLLYSFIKVLVKSGPSNICLNPFISLLLHFFIGSLSFFRLTCLLQFSRAATPLRLFICSSAIDPSLVVPIPLLVPAASARSPALLWSQALFPLQAGSKSYFKNSISPDYNLMFLCCWRD